MREAALPTAILRDFHRAHIRNLVGSRHFVRLLQMGINSLSRRFNRGVSNAKNFLGRAYRGVSKFAGNLDGYMNTAKNVIGAVAPVAGALTGPVGSAVGTGLGVAMKGMSAYDFLKSEAMGHMAQAGNVASAAKRGLGY